MTTQRWQVLVGDCLATLPTIPSESVDCCVTSPPYFGLRDYGHADQIGLEETPDQYVAKMVAVFAEVKRILKPSGTCWLNIGDSYASDTKGSGGTGKGTIHGSRVHGNNGHQSHAARKVSCDVPPKNLLGIPWRLAFALQADGWYLRDEIIWHKPNPMPESVTDRCTKAHEKVFLLAKSERYFFDAEAIAEPSIDPPGKSRGGSLSRFGADEMLVAANAHRGTEEYRSSGKRNRRNVWTIATQPCKEAHFAVMPPELARLCIVAGTPHGGTVLDPFTGAGTTGLVAGREGRNFVGCELNPEYAAIAERRIRDAYAQGKLDLFSEES